MTHTRQLFRTLEQQKEELVVTLTLFQQDKDLLSAAHHETIQEINGITESFHDLSVQHKQQVDSLTAQGKSGSLPQSFVAKVLVNSNSV